MLGSSGAINMRWGLIWACALCASCTSIRNVHGSSKANVLDDDAGPGDTGTVITDAGTTLTNVMPQPDAGQPATPDTVAKPKTHCDESGAHACSGHASTMPLVCDGANWIPDTPCAADQRCDTTPGPSQGVCRPIAAECANRQPGVAFCDADQMRVCADLVSSEVRTCPAGKRCMLQDSRAVCACPPGTIDDGSTCRAATSCTTAQGGCDPMTTCSMTADKPTCSSCPSGFSGDGSQGCAPTPITLLASIGVLSPPLSATVHQYQLPVPLLVQRVTMTAEAPSQSTLEWDGTTTPSGSGWLSPLLTLGDNPLRLVLTSQYGVSSEYDVNVQRSGSQVAYLKAAVPKAEDTFGWGVAVSGDTLVVGALFEDGAAGGVNGDQSNDGARDSGAAYVFVRQGETWVQQAYLKDDSPTANDLFGASVAIDGDTIAVGATRDDPWHGASGITPRPGSVYVFVRRNGAWSQEARLAPQASASDDLVGISVALQGDTLVFGAANDSVGATHSGAAYVFTRSAGVWSEGQRLKASKPVAEARFGASVAIDANTIVVGAPYDATGTTAAGSADVFELRSGTWVDVAQLRAPSASDHAVFGQSVAVHGGALAIGAPHTDFVLSLPHGDVYTFERVGDQWTPSAMLKAPNPRPNDYFGSNVKLTDTALLVGANGDASGARGLNGDAARSDAQYEGAAYLFSRLGSSYTQSAYIKPNNAEHDDAFGEWVALSDDSVIVSAIYESSASGGVNGNQNDNGATRAGAVYVFR